MDSTRRPRRPSMGLVFLCAVLAGAGLVLADAGWNRYASERTLARVAPRHLGPGVDVTTQVALDDIAGLGRHYRVLIDLRPDGEAAGQPSSQDVERAARAAGMGFVYVPVPHGEIPESAVARLRDSLGRPSSGVLLYCRSGRRAARTWALAQAESPDGPTADAILAGVHAAGQDAADLRPRIEAAIAARGAAR